MALVLVLAEMTEGTVPGSHLASRCIALSRAEQPELSYICLQIIGPWRSDPQSSRPPSP